ncbi:TadE family type IV pilus minor pilin [Corynebacterium lactis]|uniref:Membrane protein n=1 Tax=Corynebacterium lactis RW2-5 TaxID=1408189 RepID=A0A0K2GXN4_9CORY|nr:TadE family type IV pilus minor pilin [Corynebacterium lactis]ALA66554.1 membrane protein [Corynebacterium lactis RW2-5]
MSSRIRPARADASADAPADALTDALVDILTGEDGQATVETAFGIAAIVTVMMSALTGLVAVAMYLGLTDAAGVIARAHARGDAETVAKLQDGLQGAVTINDGSSTVEVTVTGTVGPFPLEARAVALNEKAVAE